MELRHILGFVRTAEELHFGRAAARLHITQPALSQQIRAFELELGAKLFERSTRTVTLTGAGQAVLPAARRVLSDVDLVRRAVAVGSEHVVGSVRLGFAGASSRHALSTLTRAARARMPGVELVLEGQTYASIAENRVRSGAIDIGFSRLPLSTPDLEHHVYEREQLVVVMPIDHPLAAPGAIDVAELAREPFVTFPPDAGSSVRTALMLVAQNAGFSPNIVQEAPDSSTILGLVDAGVGLTITVSSVLHIKSPTLFHRPIAGRVRTRDACLVWRADAQSSAVAAVVELAREVLPNPH